MAGGGEGRQLPTGGIPNTVPVQGYGFPATMPVMAIDFWGDACVLVPWAEYQARGDVEILRKMYPAMKKYVNACRFWAGFGFGKNRYIWYTPATLHFGDWVAPDVPKMQQWQARSKWTATASLKNTSGLLARIARILGENADAEHYQALSDKVADAYVSVFTDGNGKMKEEFQTAYVLPLYFGMFPEKVRRQAADNLARLVEAGDWCIGTGFPGTPYILFALADNGHLEEAYRMLLNTKCPTGCMRCAWAPPPLGTVGRSGRKRRLPHRRRRHRPDDLLQPLCFRCGGGLLLPAHSGSGARAARLQNLPSVPQTGRRPHLGKGKPAHSLWCDPYPVGHSKRRICPGGAGAGGHSLHPHTAGWLHPGLRQRAVCV